MTSDKCSVRPHEVTVSLCLRLGSGVFVMLGGMMQVRSWPQECVGMTGVMML